jgi:hypothetical protein
MLEVPSNVQLHAHVTMAMELQTCSADEAGVGCRQGNVAKRGARGGYRAWQVTEIKMIGGKMGWMGVEKLESKLEWD